MSPKAFPAKAAFVMANPKAKLLDPLREVMRVKHYRLRTEEAYGQWVRRYLIFHRDAAGGWRHPRDLSAADVVAFLKHLANREHVAAGIHNQALNSLMFLNTQRDATMVAYARWMGSNHQWTRIDTNQVVEKPVDGKAGQL